MAELVIKIGDRPAGLWQDGDIVNAWNDDHIAEQWKEAEKNVPKWCEGKDRRFAPLSDNMLKKFLSIRVGDFSEVVAESLAEVEWEDEKREVLLQKRLHKVNWQKFATDEGFSQTDIADTDKVVDCRGVVVDRLTTVEPKASLKSG